MKRTAIAALCTAAGFAVFVVIAKGGHELPIYPSYYPHEIRIETVAPAEAASLLTAGRLQAYAGPMASAVRSSDTIGFVESLGAFVVARLNPASPHASVDASACDAMRSALSVLQGRQGFIAHPYPVTPFHGDYLYHADLAAAANERFSAFPTSPLALRIKAGGTAARLIGNGQLEGDGGEWDVTVEAVDAADLVRTAMSAMNGWLGPPWVKSGWYHATILLSDGVANMPARAAALWQRLTTDEHADAVERLNLERALVQTLTGDCNRAVLGYTVKRQPISTEFSAGIENVAFDAIEGLASPMFLRTVKLKDFPWNGWLALGIDGAPAAAWNPVGGMNDRFGRLMWFAIADAAAIPSPYDADWVLNRIADVEAVP